MKNKKIMKKFIKSLSYAEKFAIENRDIEALVAISDRWYAFLNEDDAEEKQRLALGFINQELHDDGGKTNNKR